LTYPSEDCMHMKHLLLLLLVAEEAKWHRVRVLIGEQRSKVQ
jgi:hypothetical protein